MSEQLWFLAIDGRQEGPFPESAIVAMLADGRVTPDTFVWTKGMADWRRVDEVPTFGAAGRASTPPPLGTVALPGGPRAAAEEEWRSTPIVGEFGVWPLLGRVLLATIGLLLVIPAPWALTSYYRWLVTHLRIPTVPAIGFRGQVKDIWWVFVLMGLLSYVGGLRNDWLPLLAFPINAALSWITIRWVVSNVSSQGMPFTWRFEGNIWAYIGWTLLFYLSFITIIGWAWVASAFMRWIARNIVDPSRVVSFTASGWQILWRSFLFVLGICFIIPIPWVLHWYTRWFIGQFSVGLSRG
jgi:GYF domain 2